MYIGKLALLAQSHRLAPSFVEGVAMQHDSSAELAAAGHFHQRRETRHHYCHGYAKRPPVPGQAQRMVPCRSRNRPQTRPVRWQLCQGVARSAFLETPGPLKMLLFAENACAGQLAERCGF